MKNKYESEILSEKELSSIIDGVTKRIYSEEIQRSKVVLSDGINLANSSEAVQQHIDFLIREKIKISEYAKVNNMTYEAAEKKLFPRRKQSLLTTRRV